MIKRVALFLSGFLLISLFSGCSSNDQATSSNNNNISETALQIQSENDKSLSSSLSPNEQTSESTVQDTDAGIDVDLTTLSSTMVYGEVNNIMLDPDAYVGKTIKMRGSYFVYPGEKNDTYHHAVIIVDATGCCAQGLEFVWNGEHSYPQDYPEQETEIEIIGIFESYGENSHRIRTEKIVECE